MEEQLHKTKTLAQYVGPIQYGGILIAVTFVYTYLLFYNWLMVLANYRGNAYNMQTIVYMQPERLHSHNIGLHRSVHGVAPSNYTILRTQPSLDRILPAVELTYLKKYARSLRLLGI